MIYNIGDFGKKIENYWFDTTNDNNNIYVHIYKDNKELEYFDMIELDYEIDYDEFIYQCKNWINNNKK